ncbi:hypothetical protein EV360DRAFT_89565 [Lentinula raphanica]|nr:hypothetical protein EV360DRAFT_89565 [Lentinula raphanica]
MSNTSQLTSSRKMELDSHSDAANYIGADDEEHSVLEDDSDGDENEDYIDDVDDGSSSLSTPNESIDFTKSVKLIRTVSSALSMHPAIRKQRMNDFSDDSVVKFYLDRRGDLGSNGSGS